MLTERGALAVAVVTGAIAFLLATLLRVEALHYLEPSVSAHWRGSINALMIYMTTLVSGLVAGLLYRRQVLAVGFLAGVAGEFARGLINLAVASHTAGWIAILVCPWVISWTSLLQRSQRGFSHQRGPQLRPRLLANGTRSERYTMIERPESTLLLYQTSDTNFADRAIEALETAGISCYRTGTGTQNLNATIGRWTDDQVSIYIHREQDTSRANEILMQLGAAIDEPIKSPHRWILFLIALVLAIVALLVAKA